MPVHRTTSDGKPANQWGNHGHKYTYTPGDEESRRRARAKAEAQGRAAHAHNKVTAAKGGYVLVNER